MFRRRRTKERDELPPDNSSVDLSAEMGLSASLDDPYHMAHYRFAFVVIPTWLFGSKGADFVRGLLQGNGRPIFGGLWFAVNSEFDIEQDAFVIDERHTTSGDAQFVVNMPRPTGRSHEAQFLGIHVPRSVIDSLDTEEFSIDGIRLIFLESSVFGLTVVGESRGAGNHFNLGGGPEPTRDGMWLVMDEVCTTDQVPPTETFDLDTGDEG